MTVWETGIRSRTGALIRLISLPSGLTIALATRGSKTLPPLASAL